MNSLLKKVVVYSVIGALQVGVYIGTTEASPKHHDRQDNNSRYGREHREQEERARENHRREQQAREQRAREEHDRHERELNRRHHETEREWHERQEREKEHHEEVMRTIGGLAILYLIFND